jgi:ATP-dependent RNA helicase RhlE
MNESIVKFDDLNLNKPLWNALDDLGFENATGTQHKVFSYAMSGKDLCGIAQTGTGKTLAYLLPLLRMWSYSKDKLPQYLILVPTVEMVSQVAAVARELAKYISFDVIEIHGGINPKIFIKTLESGCDLIVATPGRCLDLMQMGSLKAKNIKKVVLDEYDLMLDLGFKPQIEQIFAKLPPKRQHLLFSATYAEDISDWSDEYFIEPKIIEDLPEAVPATITQYAYVLPNFLSKINLLDLLLVNDAHIEKTLIFTSKKEMADLILEKLSDRGIENIDIIHGNKSFNRRKESIENFKNGTCKILIASDIASRGLDINDISHVINMDVPNPAEDYIHRVGRTGRNGQKGIAISMVSTADQEKWEEIIETIGVTVPYQDLPGFLELSDELLPFELVVTKLKSTYKTTIVDSGPAFHDKIAKNLKVNVRRNIEKEKKAKYGKSYKKEQKR